MMKVERVGKADFGCPLDDGEIGYDTCLPVTLEGLSEDFLFFRIF